MTLEELYNIAQQFPMWQIDQDLDGQIIVYTGLMFDPPLGYSGCGPQNIQAHHRPHVELREMNERDLPNVDN